MHKKVENIFSCYAHFSGSKFPSDSRDGPFCRTPSLSWTFRPKREAYYRKKSHF